jgi:hypothetical protein
MARCCGAYRYLLDNQCRLNLKGVYWSSWKDIKAGCIVRALRRYR